ncbi:unnamed protein product [Urochloa humidicola]
MHPLSAEASTIKLWLARVANHLERVEPTCDYTLVGLFGPWPQVWHSPTAAFFTTSPTMSAVDPGGQKIYEVTEMDTIPAIMEEEQLQASDFIPESIAVEDHIKLEAMPLQSNEVKDHQELVMVHMLSQVLKKALM